MKYKKEEKEQEIKLEIKKKTLKESFIELLHSPRDSNNFRYSFTIFDHDFNSGSLLYYSRWGNY